MATASSVGAATTATPQSALDGEAFLLPSGANCFETDSESEPYWQVDFRAVWKLTAVYLHLRSHESLKMSNRVEARKDAKENSVYIGMTDDTFRSCWKSVSRQGEIRPTG